MLTATQEIARQKYAYAKMAHERRLYSAERRVASMRPSTRRAFLAVPSRRAFLSGLGASALVIPAFAADTKLTNLPLGTIPDYWYGSQTSSRKFNALGFINVKDFGAVGDNSHDDTTNIQDAVNWTGNDKRGTIVFPTGTYKTTAPITFGANTSFPMIRFLGVGAAQIVGSMSGYLIDRNVNTYQAGAIEIDNLYLNNSALNQGVIRTGAAQGFAVRNCIVKGDNGILAGYDPNDINTSAFQVSVDTCIFNPEHPSGVGTACTIGNNSTVRDCDAIGFSSGVAFRGWGHAHNFIGNRSETCGVGMSLGQYAGGGTHGATGVNVSGHTWESNDYGLFIVSCNGLLVAGGELNGFAGGSPSGDPIYGVRIAADGILSAVFAGLKVSVNAPAAWAWSHAAGNGEKFSRCIGVNSSNQAVLTTGGSWQVPTNGTDMAYDNCNNGIGNQYPVMTFAQLPGSSDVPSGRAFSISDGNIGGKVLGDTITVGGSSGAIVVRWNGAAWKWASY